MMPERDSADMSCGCEEITSDVQMGAGSLEAIREEIGDCRRCSLSQKRKNIVFGEGNPEAEILFVGEGPGADEDLTGRPFVGSAGELLTRIIENGMEIPRSQVYICNIVKCRPPENRTPHDEEVGVCLPFLEKQIEAIQPRVIITLGRTAARALLKTNEAMHQIRGKWQTYRGIPLMPTFHPSYVLRRYTVPVRKLVFGDVQEVLRFLSAKKDNHAPE
jgi:DNA polymerase